MGIRFPTDAEPTRLSKSVDCTVRSSANFGISVFLVSVKSVRMQTSGTRMAKGPYGSPAVSNSAIFQNDAEAKNSFDIVRPWTSPSDGVLSYTLGVGRERPLDPRCCTLERWTRSRFCSNRHNCQCTDFSVRLVVIHRTLEDLSGFWSRIFFIGHKRVTVHTTARNIVSIVANIFHV